MLVNGMAMGCDLSGHRGALDGGGETIAVLGCGVDVCYPRSSRHIYDRIIETGSLIISEFKPGTPPARRNFPVMNRIISALSELVMQG